MLQNNNMYYIKILYQMTTNKIINRILMATKEYLENDIESTKIKHHLPDNS